MLAARIPAPWSLRGQAWIVVIRLPPASASRVAFLPSGLAPGCCRLSYLIFADYVESDCGPYHELLFVPGTFRFSDRQPHLTISRILVSTMDSVVNGRQNWGLPKDHADFKVAYGVAGREADQIVVSCRSRTIADLRLKASRLLLPVTTRVVPRAVRTFAQRLEGRDYFFAPSAHGWLSPGRFISWRFDAELFPDLAGAKILATAKLVRLTMRIPESNTRSADAEAAGA